MGQKIECISVAGTDGAVIRALRCTLTISPRCAFDIYVDSTEHDEITCAIMARTYSFPAGFALLPHLVKSGSRVLDLGAHIGTFSLFAARLGYQVASVEAAPHNAALLARSASRNRFGRLQVIPAAVSDHAGTLEFIQGGPYGVVSNPIIQGPTVSVPAITVDGLLDQIGWEHVDWIKMDIEGSEVAAIRGMPRLLARDDAPIILYESNGYTLNLFGTTPADLMALLEDFGYQCYLVEPGRLVPCKSGDLQPEACVDYVATKHALGAPEGWRIASPMSSEEQVAKILATSIHPHKFLRAYIARALEQADDSILSDLRVENALNVLRADADADVCAAAAWWQGPKNLDPQLRWFRQTLLEKDAEIAGLRELVRGYERGRFIRAMKVLDRLRRKVKSQ